MASATKTGPAAPVSLSPRRSSHLKQRKTPLVKHRDIPAEFRDTREATTEKHNRGEEQEEMTQTLLCAPSKSAVRRAFAYTVYASLRLIVVAELSSVVVYHGACREKKRR